MQQQHGRPIALVAVADRQAADLRIAIARPAVQLAQGLRAEEAGKGGVGHAAASLAAAGGPLHGTAAAAKKKCRIGCFRRPRFRAQAISASRLRLSTIDWPRM